MRARRLRTKFVPTIEVAVTSSKPRESDEIDLFVHIEVMDESDELHSNRIVGMILQNVAHPVISRVRTGIRVSYGIFGVEPARHRNDRADFFCGDRDFRNFTHRCIPSEQTVCDTSKTIYSDA